jgi:hypothetical protein
MSADDEIGEDASGRAASAPDAPPSIATVRPSRFTPNGLFDGPFDGNASI